MNLPNLDAARDAATTLLQALRDAESVARLYDLALADLACANDRAERAERGIRHAEALARIVGEPHSAARDRAMKVAASRLLLSLADPTAPAGTIELPEATPAPPPGEARSGGGVRQLQPVPVAPMSPAGRAAALPLS